MEIFGPFLFHAPAFNETATLSFWCISPFVLKACSDRDSLKPIRSGNRIVIKP
jgi:hypothetical protein